MVTSVSQLSEATGVPTGGIASQDTVASAGTDVNTGAEKSLTVSVCVAVAVLPQ
jgi:hypothetical protein